MSCTFLRATRRAGQCKSSARMHAAGCMHASRATARHARMNSGKVFGVEQLGKAGARDQQRPVMLSCEQLGGRYACGPLVCVCTPDGRGLLLLNPPLQCSMPQTRQFDCCVSGRGPCSIVSRPWTTGTFADGAPGLDSAGAMEWYSET
jgi:hypothetical protein